MHLRRRRGRPRKGEVRAPVEEKSQTLIQAKKVKAELDKLPAQQSSSYKHSVLTTYDDVHSNFATAYCNGIDARTVDLSQIVKTDQEGTEP